MARNSYFIVSEEWRFPSKTAAAAYVRSILAAHKHGQRLTGADDSFMRALLKLHPRLGIIEGCGIAWIYVEHRDGGRGFTVRRTDHSAFDFRWMECLYPRNSFSLLSGICRDLIQPQVTEFRDRRFRGICEVCAETLQLRACQVDHIPPATFENLLEGWLKSMHLSADDLDITRSKSYGVRSTIDPFLAQQWIEYHEINARLRCACRPCNLSVIRKTSPRNMVAIGT